MKNALLVVAVAVLGTAVVADEAPPAPAPPALRALLDDSVAPGDDFFAYANGQWLRHTEIPADRSAYGAGRELSDLTDQRNAALIRQVAASNAAAGSNRRKIADYYDSFMDQAAIERRGLTVLQPTLARIERIADPASLARFLGSTLRTDIDILNNTSMHTDRLFGLWIAQNLDDPQHYVPFVFQGGLGMPDRDYYLSASAAMAAARTQYLAHIAAVLTLAGTDATTAAQQARTVFALELAIARSHTSRGDSEDVQRGDNHWSRAQFIERAPGLDWQAYFEAAGLGQQTQFIVWQPAAVSGIAALVASQSLADWRAYLRFHAIDHVATLLPQAFVDEQFNFYGRQLQGTQQLSERWKRAVESTDAALGEAVGRLYVERYFPARDKADIEQMVRHLLAAFAARIDALAWMSAPTKLEAKAKLRALKVGIGYPDHWRDYTGLQIVAGDAYGNAQRAELFDYHRHLAQLRAPVDRDEWVMNPQLVNAVNLPAMNALNFPAAILQPPYYDSRRSAAMNYGAIGAIIGHEISHSFDNEGAQFDAQGRLRNWWTEADLAHFKASAQQLVQQFDGYRPFDDLAVNGEQTLSENIADVAGLAAAWDAYQSSLQGAAPAPALEGFSGGQQFFLSFAQMWREKYRDAALRRAIATDGHAPAQYRAQTVRNNDAWYGLFDVRPGQQLYLAPEQRVRMW